ncbi:AAA-type ATPase lid domain-containing protein [Cellvibrio mixtus]|uniref:sigma 54-interacting transcriptional regulator n=1 Tax=Cellvibrio mixtus TaxID=39650 RepID=UPI000587DDF9|nr:sigma 54-interacting transcriptional regulator [Cellvibrio mixtus]
MIGLFKASSTHKPVARAIHKFNQSSTAKWVPVNKSFITLTKIILRAASERLNLAHLAVTLRCVTHQGYRHLLLVNDERDLQLAAIGQTEEFIISAQDSIGAPFANFKADAAYSLPIDFKPPQGSVQRLGYLVAQSRPGSVIKREQLLKDLALVADEIVRTIGRYQTRYRAIHVYGDQSYWIGNSKALRQLDQRMDLLAKGNLPVLVRADKGAGKVIAARSLHCLGRPELAPFIESDCTEWEQGNAASILQSLHSFANGGTLFLRNLDALTATDFQHLYEFWRRASQAEFDGSYSLKLIVSLSRIDCTLGSAQQQWLAQHTQELRLPGLNERREDIRDLAQFFIREFGFGDGFDLTESAWCLLESAPWPGNVEQLKQLIKKLVLIADADLISADELAPLLEQH